MPRISDTVLATIIENEGEARPGHPVSALGVLRLALDLQAARVALRAALAPRECCGRCGNPGHHQDSCPDRYGAAGQGS